MSVPIVFYIVYINTCKYIYNYIVLKYSLYLHTVLYILAYLLLNKIFSLVNNQEKYGLFWYYLFNTN